jgi:hypothetical protein
LLLFCCSPLQLNTIRNDSVEFVLANSKCYLKELTLHYYPYYKPKDINYQLLLGEDLMREAVRNVSVHLANAAKYNQTLRISEANSQSGMEQGPWQGEGKGGGKRGGGGVEGGWRGCGRGVEDECGQAG